jgi:hypothetical protein
MRSWQHQHVRAAGRAAACAAIRHEAPGVTPECLSHPALPKNERRNIACIAGPAINPVQGFQT